MAVGPSILPKDSFRLGGIPNRGPGASKNREVLIDVTIERTKLREYVAPCEVPMSAVKNPPPRAPSEAAHVVRTEYKPNLELARRVMRSVVEDVERVYGAGSASPPSSDCGSDD